MSGVREILQNRELCMWRRTTRSPAWSAYGGDPRRSHSGPRGGAVAGSIQRADLMKRVVLERLDPEVTAVKDS